jgi:ADP-ribosylglycohydrolase
MSDRARGALVGLAVGDALGTTLEFKDLRAPAFPTLAEGPHDEITGGGPFAVEPGQVTDDTQMACCLAASLVENGRYDLADATARYLAWAPHAFDIGSTTSAALAGHARGNRQAARDVWEAGGGTGAANGALMRTAPIGVFFARDPDARRAAAVEDTMITHWDVRCRLASAAFDAAIACGVSGARDAEELVVAAEGELDGGVLNEDLALARRDDPELGTMIYQAQGFVRVAFRLAFWELLHAPSFRAGVVDVVNRGGDADTNGAIAGALLGAFHGARSIPESWQARVLDAPPDGRLGPVKEACHPRVLLRLLQPRA